MNIQNKTFRQITFSILSTILCASFSTQSFSAEDSDNDGILDVIDNCVMRKNADQRDTDADGIGNICDADLDNSGFVNSIDFSIFKQRLLTNDPDADLDGNGFVNSIDFSLFKKMLLQRPGPSNTKVEPSFIQAPPPAVETSLFSLEEIKKMGKMQP